MNDEGSNGSGKNDFTDLIQDAYESLKDIFKENKKSGSKHPAPGNVTPSNYVPFKGKLTPSQYNTNVVGDSCESFIKFLEESIDGTRENFLKLLSHMEQSGSYVHIADPDERAYYQGMHKFLKSSQELIQTAYNHPDPKVKEQVTNFLSAAFLLYQGGPFRRGAK